MNVTVNSEMITNENIFFYDEVENKVMHNSLFIQTGFSNELFSLSGIYIATNFDIAHIDRYFKKYKYILTPDENTCQIDNLIKIEKMILSNLDRPHLTKIYRLQQQLDTQSVLVFDCGDVSTIKHMTGRRSLMLKISGVWINENSCGITFKFFHIN
jgi:hypothetical protein